jgi:zinc transporter ZupT
MSLQLFFTLLAASIGFISGIFLCVGSVLLSKRNIMNLATQFWDFSEVQARAVTAQSTQYAFGGFLLIISFGVQVAAASDVQIRLPATLANPFVFAMLSVCVIGGIAFLAYCIVNRWRTNGVLFALAERTRMDAENVKKGFQSK